MTIDYDRQAAKWQRDEPKHHSDFCGRPEVLALCERLCRGKAVLDVGCGEGYFARKLASIAGSVVGVDLSMGMVRHAVEMERQEQGKTQRRPQRIHYVVGDALRAPFRDGTFDVCVGNYVTNYVPPAELPAFYQELARVTNERGGCVLLMPHPLLELSTDYGDAIRYVADEIGGYDYVKSRGEFFRVALGTVGGDTLEAGYYHSTLEDHMRALSSAGWNVTGLREPVFPEAVAERYPVFKRMGGKVACMILIGKM